MDTIDQYTIYCSEEQTKKALELGAKISNARVIDTVEGKSIRFPEETGDFYTLPTAEQMMGWLDEKGVEVRPVKIRYRDHTVAYAFTIFDNDGFYLPYRNGNYPTRKEAVLAAIDAALDYLIKNKE